MDDFGDWSSHNWRVNETWLGCGNGNKNGQNNLITHNNITTNSIKKIQVQNAKKKKQQTNKCDVLFAALVIIEYNFFENIRRHLFPFLFQNERIAQFIININNSGILHIPIWTFWMGIFNAECYDFSYRTQTVNWYKWVSSEAFYTINRLTISNGSFSLYRRALNDRCCI